MQRCKSFRWECVDTCMSWWSRYSHYPWRWLRGRQATILRQCLHTTRQPCFSQQNVFVPTHSGHHCVDVKKAKLFREKEHICGHPFLANDIFKQNRFTPRHTDRLIHAIWIIFYYFFFFLPLFKKLTNEFQQHVCNIKSDLLWHWWSVT